MTTEISTCCAGKSLLVALRDAGVIIAAPCGGNGRCGKCRVRIAGGEFRDAVTGAVVAAGTEVNACRTVCTCAGGIVEVPDTDISVAACSEFHRVWTPDDGQCGIAVDLGTTTISTAIVRMGDGLVLGTLTGLNPQCWRGADVVSRISAADRYLREMRQDAVGTVGTMISRLVDEVGYKEDIHSVAITGNPVMIHIFRGYSPSGMGAFPFKQSFSGEVTDNGADYDLPCADVIFPTSASPFIGSDVTTGVAALDIASRREPCLFADLGTNGEIVMYSGKNYGGRFFAASTSAGPALEGAGISCGVGGVRGAVCVVRDDLSFQTIGNAPVEGICGSGLVDLIAVLLKRGVIDETGFMQPVQFSLPDEPDVALTREDVRQFQLAKAALNAGLEVVASEAGVGIGEIDTCFIAGGLGTYLDKNSARRAGLFPQGFRGQLVCSGNTSLTGAVKTLVSSDFRRRVREEVRNYKIVELATSEMFSDLFIKRMAFEAVK